jgi:radical SAM enzyme (TIGR01210 family)
MEKMMILNQKLLNEYFLLNIHHNILFDIQHNNDLIIESEEIDNLINYLYLLVEENKDFDGLYCINSIDDFLLYLGDFVYQKLNIYKSNFKNKDEFILFLFCNIVLFLTQFSHEAMNILKIMPLSLKSKLKNNLLHIINSYTDAFDSRGLLFFFCKEYNIVFDNIYKNNGLKYIYQEPLINKKWQNKYKKEGDHINMWFYNSILGKALFVVLYGPKCRYKTDFGGCAGCNLPTVSSKNIIPNEDDYKKQINNIFDNLLSSKEKKSIKELMLSNNGSILDDKTISNQSLSYIVTKSIESLEKVTKIIFETRIDNYTNVKQLSYVKQLIHNNSKNIQLEIAIGFEIFDDNLRNGFYKKGLEKAILEEKIKYLSNLNFSFKVYMMFKAVPDRYMNVDDAIDDINQASKYFSNLSEKYNIKINLHISPTYLAKGTPLYIEYKKGNFTPPTVDDIENMYNKLQLENGLSYYISMNDEGVGETRISEKEYDKYLELKSIIYKFNIDNNR